MIPYIIQNGPALKMFRTTDIIHRYVSLRANQCEIKLRRHLNTAGAYDHNIAGNSCIVNCGE